MTSEQEQPQLSPEQTDKNVAKLARAVEKTYGSTLGAMFRSFLTGVAYAFGAGIGYVAMLAILIFAAKKLGIFTIIEGFWQNLLKQLPLENLKELQNLKGLGR
jgi:hypothetical protein